MTFPEDPALPRDRLEDRIRNHHYKRILPDDGDDELLSFAPYRVHIRTCPTCNVGRFVLAGDAAHIGNPCGGRGLTGGIVDVDRPITAFENILSGADERAQLDADTAERRKEFLAVSAPFASLVKAMGERSDHGCRRRTGRRS